jgi:uncharacterized RDD family membrane protein YckC
MGQAAEWYFARNGEQVGPVTLDGLRGRLQSGELGADDLVWRAGMAEWAAVGSIQAMMADVLGPPTAYNVLEVPGDAVGTTTWHNPNAAAPVGVLPYGTYQPAWPQVQYGGFWIRFVAAILDGIITGIAGLIVGAALGFACGMLMGATSTPAEIEFVAGLIGNVVGIVIGWLYDACFTASTYQGTPGKIILGLRVTDVYGNRISFGRATGRHFAKILSGIVLLIGYIVAAFDERKRSWHDHLAGTLVIKNPQ